MVEEWNRDGGIVKHTMVEQCNNSWRNSGKEIVEEWNTHGKTVEDR